MKPVHLKLFHVALLTYAIGIVLSLVLMPGKKASLSLAGTSVKLPACNAIVSAAHGSTTQAVNCPTAETEAQDNEAPTTDLKAPRTESL